MFISRFKIRNQLLISFLLLFVPLTLAGTTITYRQVHQLLKKSYERELENTTRSMARLIRTAASVSVRNRLRAIAEKNLDIAEYYYNKHRSGLLTRQQAVQLIEEIFISQRIGLSGYIYCLNSKADIIIHPRDGVRGTNQIDHDFVKKQIALKDGYMTYEWRNPGEKEKRSKALYMTYFKPLDWIISVSTYQNEFNHLVEVDDFKDSILSYRFGKTGYTYVFDEKGDLLIHPWLQGRNLQGYNEYSEKILTHIMENKSGKYKYLWQNPGEKEAREKIVFFEYLPEYGWYVAASGYVEEIAAPLQSMLRLLLVTLVVIFLLAVMFTVIISTSITHPLEALMKRLERGAKGNYSIRMAYHAPNELGKLSCYFNEFMARLEENHEQIRQEVQKHQDVQAALKENIGDLKSAESERVKLEAKLHQAQKMESIGTLASGIAHNFNNILMNIQGRASLLKMDKSDTHGDVKHLESIEAAIQRAVTLTRQLLTFAKGGPYKAISTDLNKLISQENRMFGETRKEICIHESFATDLWTVAVDPGQIQQVLLNLYINASQAMEGGGDLFVNTTNQTIMAPDNSMKQNNCGDEIPCGNYVMISVRDTGFGMDEETCRKIFDPFFTTKPTGQGTGLGLASVYGIIKSHGGMIDLVSVQGSGTTFYIYLPATHENAVSPKRIHEKTLTGEGTVLLVDDEQNILDVAKQMLERLGYRILSADSGESALEIYRTYPDEIHLVIMDMVMPGMGGKETFGRLKEINPHVKVVLASGYSINGQAREMLTRGCLDFIQKPFTLNELSKKVQEALSA